MWVSPIEIENVLMEHPMVQEAAAIGNPDANKLVKPSAYVVLKDGANNIPQIIEEIRQHMQSKLAAFKCPQTLEIVKELPKTATGKIQRYKLRQSATETNTHSTNK
jgi:acyl-coenzyme A synthetase/AMP-(fatty) acid ligase